jgi:hypothetical protein
MTKCLSRSQDDDSMMMCLSRAQDDDSMMIVSVEEHRISRVKRACVRRHLMVMTNHKMLIA